MLKFFRKHARGWFMVTIMFVIIIVFVLYFGSNRGKESSSAIAIVDGRIISEGEFRDEHAKLLDMAKAKYGSALTPEVIKKMNLKQMAYDDLINRQIIIVKAADLKVRISDEELRSKIVSTPALQTDGVFDDRKYQQMLRYNKSSAEDFETMQKIDLMANKIESLVREGIKISDKEILDVYTMQNQQINLNYLQISGKDIKKTVVPTPADLESHLKANSNLFRIPEQVKVKYISFSSASYASSPVTDSEVLDYYKRNQDKFKTKEGKQLAFADVQNAISQEMKKARGMQDAYKAAKKAHDAIYQEDNFDDYCAKNKLDIHSFDFFPLNSPPREFATIKDLATTLADLGKNDISKVLAGDSNYYVLRIIDKKAAYLPRLKEVENEVARHFVANEIGNLAAKETETILGRLKKGESLEKVAQEYGLKIGETGFFQPGNTIPKLGMLSDGADIIVQMSAGKPYAEKAIVINNSFVILKFKDATKIDLNDFASRKDLYKKIYISIKRQEAIQAWLEGNKALMIKEKRIKINKEAKDL
jgi:peptidyl-prolyl cis-trans isomerase D